MKTIFNYSRVIRAILMIIMFVQARSTVIAQEDYMIGADLSFLKQAEDKGVQFKENGIVKPGLQIFKEHGYNWIRLRIFHTPTQLPNNLSYTVSLAKKAKEMGYKFLLDFHYSDTWTDPGKQIIPEAWQGMTHKQLVKAVYEYSRETMKAFREAGAFPDMVQVGNEVTNGIMWPDGKLPENRDNYAELTQAGINGVFAGCDTVNRPKILMQHAIDQIGNINHFRQYFDKLTSHGIEFDYIGLSYYPWWHGSLLDLRKALFFMAKEYKKPMVVVETAYCSEPSEYKKKNGPFPETPEGQKEFVEELNKIVLDIPDHLGAGIFWWEAATGGTARDFFDENGNVQPVITVFDKFTRH